MVFGFSAQAQMDDGRSRRVMPRCYMVGLLDQPLHLQVAGTLKVVAARLYGWGAYALLGPRSKSPSPVLWLLEGPWRSLANEIERAVLEDDATAAVAMLQDFLTERARRIAHDPHIMHIAAKWLWQANGHLQLADLADHSRLSPRQLERQFDTLVGVYPRSGSA